LPAGGENPQRPPEENIMPFVTVGQENSMPIELYY